MSLFKTFGTDATKENEGVWLREFPPNADGTVPGFLLARKSKSNTNYAKAAEKIGKKFRKEISLDILSDDRADPALKELFVSTVLLGWENVFDANDQPITYSKENALKLIEALPDLYAYLDDEAGKLSNFRAAANEADLKN